MNLKALEKNKILAIGLLFAVLIGFGGVYFITETFGKSLYLEIDPYDPVDLFRGDYVNLQYKIETINMDLVDKTMYEEVKEAGNGISYLNIKNSTGYIVYEEYSNPLKVTAFVPDRPKGSNYIKAKFLYINDYNNEARLNIGLNRFYVPEGTGYELENMSREDRLVVEVKKLGFFYTLKGIRAIE